MNVRKSDTPWMAVQGRRVGLWLGGLGCCALLPLIAVAVENNDVTSSDANKQTSRTARGLVFSPQISGALSNWPSSNIETGFLNRAVMPPRQKLDFKWANTLGQITYNKTNSIEVPDEFALPAPRAPRGMTLIPGGMFVMGFGAMPPGNEAVARKISSYYIDAFEVPGCVWTEICQWASTHGYTNLAKGQSGATQGGGEGGPDHPVVNVSWYDCVKWCNARSEKERLLPVYYLSGTQKQVYRNGLQDISNICVDWTANGYRLPTEVEWEKAARGGVSGMLYPFGDNLNMHWANYRADQNSHTNGTTAIGQFRTKFVEVSGKKVIISDENGYGLHDMAGNVYEWCWDWFGSYTTNAYGPDSGVYRVMRGGCWASVEDVNLSCGFRNAMRPGTTSPYVGFRCVRKH